MIVYAIETFNSDRVVPYKICKYKLCQFSGKYCRDITQGVYENCINDCIVFERTNCINEK